MKPSGTIYKASGSPRGEIRIALTEKEKKRFKFIRLLGANISSLALAFVVFFYGPPFELALDYEAGLAKAEVGRGEVLAPTYEGRMIPAPTDQPVANNQFALSIPAIGATANIIKDVNAFDEVSYHEALKQGIAHAQGTGKPGEGKRIYMFAHSTNSPLYFSEYNAIFYQLRLLEEGEKIFVSYNGDAHIYTVKEKVVVDANDTHWLTETGNEEQLVLQTCDPPGTTLRRLLVIAEPVK